MINLTQWAIAWRIPPEALADLAARLGAGSELPAPGDARSEAGAQALIRLEATQLGGRLWRNNVGAGELADGSFVRWGLANDSKAMNQHIKSADLVGIMPRRIGPEHVGQVWGVFTSREVKAPGWRYSGTPREQAQLAWAQLVVSLGGDAAFATGPGSIDAAVKSALPLPSQPRGTK